MVRYSDRFGGGGHSDASFLVFFSSLYEEYVIYFEAGVALYFINIHIPPLK